MTYNVFGLKYIAGHRSARIREIGHQITLLSPPPHIICLQECFTEHDYLAIRQATATILPHGKLFYSGFFGAGLAILSCWPIQDSCMYPYPLNGRPTGFFRGDWYVGKGVGWARVRIPESFLMSALPPSSTSSIMHEDDGLAKTDQQHHNQTHQETLPPTYISVYTTHLHAPYHSLDSHKNAYLPHRTFQSWFLSTLLRGSLDRGDLVIAGGDFNSLPASLPHRILTSRGGVRDVWRVLRPSSSWGPVSDSRERSRGRLVPSAKFNQTENGATSDSVYNTWRWSPDQQKKQYALGPTTGEMIDGGGDAVITSRRRHIPDDTPDPRGKRLDYIFYGHNPHHYHHHHHHQTGSPQPLPQWNLHSAHVGMTILHPDIHCSLSDHFSVHATFTLSPFPSPSPSLSPSSPFPLSPPEDTTTGDTAPLTHPELTQTLSLITQELTHITSLRRLHWSLFALAIGIMYPACAVGIWWASSSIPGVAFLLVVLTGLATAGGVVSGLIAGLWCWGERRAWGGWEEDVRGLLVDDDDGRERSENGETSVSAYLKPVL